MDKALSIRSGLFLVGLFDSIAAAREIITAPDGVVRMIGSIFSLQSILWGLLAAGIGLMLIAGLPVVRMLVQWPARAQKRKSEEMALAIRECISITQAPSSDIDPVEMEEIVSRYFINLGKLRDNKLLPGKGRLKFANAAEYLSGLAPFVEAYGVKRASALRKSLEDRLKTQGDE